MINGRQAFAVQNEYVVDPTFQSIWMGAKLGNGDYHIGGWGGSLFYGPLRWIIRWAPLVASKVKQSQIEFSAK